MFDRFSDQARRLVVQAQEEVRVLHHAELDAAHLLLAIAEIPGSDAVTALGEMGTSAETVQDHIRGARNRSLLADGVVDPVHAASTPGPRSGRRGVGTARRRFRRHGPHPVGDPRREEGHRRRGPAALDIDLDRARIVVAGMPSSESNAGAALQPPTVIGGRTGTRPSGAAAGLVAAGPPMMPFPPMMGFPPDSTPRCGFCGRDLWDVAHFVSGDNGAICSECITAAQRIIDSAADDQHSLTLAPRVFGRVPHPDAPELIEEAFRSVFGTLATPASRRRLMEDGDSVVRYLEEAQAKFGVRVQEVRLKRIRFVDGRRADVQFAFSLSSSHWMPFDGNAVHHDGRWMVGRDTIGRLLQMAGVTLPPRTT